MRGFLSDIDHPGKSYGDMGAYINRSTCAGSHISDLACGKAGHGSQPGGGKPGLERGIIPDSAGHIVCLAVNIYCQELRHIFK